MYLRYIAMTRLISKQALKVTRNLCLRFSQDLPSGHFAAFKEPDSIAPNHRPNVFRHKNNMMKLLHHRNHFYQPIQIHCIILTYFIRYLEQILSAYYHHHPNYQNKRRKRRARYTNRTRNNRLIPAQKYFKNNPVAQILSR